VFGKGSAQSKTARGWHRHDGREKEIGRPALRHFGPAERERIRLMRTQGASVRKLAKDFATTQWMIAKLTGSSEAAESVAA
jgi:hypothetical protein